MFTFNVNITADTASILEAIRRLEEKMAIDLSRLENKVTAIKDASDAAEALLAGIAQQLRDLIAQSGDLPGLQNRINDLATTLETEATELGNAVVANTPTPPAPPADPNATFDPNAPPVDPNATRRRIP